jgi:protein-L-isoaspartate(D-aspartate) O-methyltransferase
MGLRRGRSDPQTARKEMVERQLRRRGISDERVLAAMGEVPRERFVREPERGRAYADRALPIGHGQTISQPWIVAAICQALELGGDERVLEVGTGSGYSAAVLARLAAEVLSVERIEPLAERAKLTLDELGVANVEVLIGDGSGGVAGAGPFDAIAVHAAAPSAPAGLISGLAPGGRLVVPIAEGPADILTLLERGADGELSARAIGPSRFVPLIGDEGFDG